MNAREKLLSVRKLQITYASGHRETAPLQGIDLDIGQGETLAVVGESGCGKSTLLLSIMGLLPAEKARISGRIEFEGRSLLGCPKQEMAGLRGREIAMVFQDPRSALNPYYTLGAQLLEAGGTGSRRERQFRAMELLGRVRLADPKRVMASYPHELSGGMLQRVMIAMAMMNGPKLLLADEPTTALDVTVQRDILQLLRELQQENGMGLLFISHDLAVVSKIADRIAVMHAGKIVECGKRMKVLQSPDHPYTCRLLESVPVLGSSLLGKHPWQDEAVGAIPMAREAVLR